MLLCVFFFLRNSLGKKERKKENKKRHEKKRLKESSKQVKKEREKKKKKKGKRKQKLKRGWGKNEKMKKCWEATKRKREKKLNKNNWKIFEKIKVDEMSEFKTKMDLEQFLSFHQNQPRNPPCPGLCAREATMIPLMSIKGEVYFFSNPSRTLPW